MKQPWIIDTTLRDGEQAAGIAFPSEQSFEIAKKLSSVGIPELEIGTPAMGDAEIEKMRRICRAKLGCRTTAWCRAIENDIDVAIRTEVDAVHISFPVSDIHLNALRKSRTWVLEQVDHLVGVAKQRVGYVSVGAQDASRADHDWLKLFGSQAVTAGADRLRIADTVGIWDPIQCSEVIRALRFVLPTIELAAHTHNDLGMATANAVTALCAGADAVDVTVNGLGERAGNAALEEVVMAIEVARGTRSNVVLSELIALSQLVAQCSGRAIHRQKPVVGAGAFAHESGIHVQALLRDQRTYEPFEPELLGRGRPGFVLGKHSGLSALQDALKAQGLSVDPERLPALLSLVRRRAEEVPGPLTGSELAALATAC
jgi:homocitrate synthase NifV